MKAVRAAFCVIFAALCAADGASAAPGELDPSFAGSGLRISPYTGIDMIPAAIRVDSRGRVLLLQVEFLQPQRSAVTRLLPDGSVDSSYGVDGHAVLDLSVARFRAASLEVLPDDAVVVVGFPPESTGPCAVMARIDPDGRHDRAFGAGGAATIPAGASRCTTAGGSRVVVQPGGGFVLIREIFDIWTGLRLDFGFELTRYHGDGTLDTAFGENGSFLRFQQAPDRRVFDVVALADGGLELFTSGAGFSLLRLTATGQVDASWAGAGRKTVDSPGTGLSDLDAHTLGDGSRVFLYRTSSDTTSVTLLRLDAEGRRMAAFGSNGQAQLEGMNPSPSEVALAPDGAIVVMGAARNFGRIFARIDASGRIDESVGLQGYKSHPFHYGINPYYADIAYLHASGELYVAGNYPPVSGADSVRRHVVARIQAVPDIVEFHNTIINHYFLAYDGLEAKGIDAGAAGPGWTRTRQGFRPGGTTPVCRFYGEPGVGPNSHFFTIEPGECEEVKRSPGWLYEGLGFYATRLANGTCPSPLVTVRRLYNNRAAANDSNHRYVTDLALVPPMTAQGWVLEGPVFCAKP